MLISELEELGKELRLGKEELAKELEISFERLNEIYASDEIQDVQILSKIRSIQCRLERMKINKYAEILSEQPTGPFKSGKIYAHPSELNLLYKAPNKTTPITLELHLSNICDHHCPFCTFRDSVHKSLERNATFPLELIDNIIRDSKKMHIKAIVYSGGGEPLLYSNFIKVVEKFSSINIDQGLITNGSKLDDDDILKSVIKNFSWIRVSVDAGSANVYERTHGTDQKFEKIINNVKRLSRLKKDLHSSKPRIGVSFLLTMENYNDLIRAVEVFSETGIDYFQVKPLVMNAEERIASGNIFWKQAVFDQLLALPAHSKTNYHVYTLGFKFIDLLKAVNKKQFSKCHGHPFYPVITANGKIYVCCLMIGHEKLCYGELTNEIGFYEIWTTKERPKIGNSVNVLSCPLNCKLSETNKTLEPFFTANYDDPNFLN